MTTMLERVVEGFREEITRQQKRSGAYADFSDLEAVKLDGHFDLRVLARAALAAMREPTDEMYEAVDCGGEKRNWLSGKMHRFNWQKMIDAAFTGPKTIDSDRIAGLIEGDADAD